MPQKEYHVLFRAWGCQQVSLLIMLSLITGLRWHLPDFPLIIIKDLEEATLKHQILFPPTTSIVAAIDSCSSQLIDVSQ